MQPQGKNLCTNLTISAQVDQAVFVADSGGSLNNTYFLISSPTVNYYVWFNINSAGTDPALSGKTGIAVAGATGASAATLATAARTAIAAVGSSAVFSTGGSSATVTITNLVGGKVTNIADGAAPTSFTFSTPTPGVGVMQDQPYVEWPGGRAAVVIIGTTYPTNVFLKMLLNDGSTLLSINASTYSANKIDVYDLPAGSYKLSLSGGTASALYADLVTIPYG